MHATIWPTGPLETEGHGVGMLDTGVSQNLWYHYHLKLEKQMEKNMDNETETDLYIYICIYMGLCRGL